MTPHSALHGTSFIYLGRMMSWLTLLTFKPAVPGTLGISNLMLRPLSHPLRPIFISNLEEGMNNEVIKFVVAKKKSFVLIKTREDL